MANIKYHYALNEKGRVTDIKSVYRETRHDHTYTCPGCGAEMVPRLGEVRLWHFAHAAGTISCGKETYLHKLGKMLLKQKFDDSSEFKVGFYRKTFCNRATQCPFYRQEECHREILTVFDLKRFYDTCEMERPVGDFIADLLLTNSTGRYREPVLIEIQNKHKVDAPKRNSGYRIIEVRIREEEDITYLVNNPIIESLESRHDHFKDTDTIGFGKFYGFKREAGEPQQLDCRNIYRFYLFRSGSAFVTNMDEPRPCSSVGIKDNPKAILELDIDSDYLGSPSIYDYGYAKAMELGFTVKSCVLCKYRKDGFESFYGNSPNFCCLHKKYGTPEYPDNKEAVDCQYYRINHDALNEIKAKLPQIPILQAK